MSDALTGDVPLNLGLVDPIDTGPDEGPTDTNGPESVSPQRVWVKASGTIKKTSWDIHTHTDSKSFHDTFLNYFGLSSSVDYSRVVWPGAAAGQQLYKHVPVAESHRATYTHSQKLSLPPCSESEMMGLTPPCWSTDLMMTDKKPASMTPSCNRDILDFFFLFNESTLFSDVVFGLNCYLEDIRPHHCSQTTLKQDCMSLMVTEISVQATLTWISCLSFFTHHGAIKGADHPGGDNCTPQIHTSYCREKVGGTVGRVQL